MSSFKLATGREAGLNRHPLRLLGLAGALGLLLALSWVVQLPGSSLGMGGDQGLHDAAIAADWGRADFVADAVADDQGSDTWLHGADVTIKGGDADPATSYNTVSIAPVAGRLATACASLAKRKEDAALTDGAGVSIFVSDPVPPGEAREIAGTWTFRLYMWATSHPRLSMRAKIYLIQVDGTTKELAEAHDNKRRDLALSPQEVTWAYDMPAGTILNAGERFGVQFLIHPEGDQWLQYAYLGFDHGTVPSGVKVPWPLWAKPETTPPARNPEGETAHLREPDCSMSWPLPWLTPSPQAVPAPTPRPASIPAPAPKPAPMLTPTLDSGLVEAGGLALAAAAAQGITFDRRLTGEKVGQHKVPPFLPVTIEIQATVSEAMPAAALADYFPASWGVQDRQGGTVSPVDAETSRISWLVGDLAVGQTVTRSYVLTPPDRTIPPTFYTFVSELSAGPTIVQSAPWEVVVADPVTTQYLHAADVVVGSTTYNTINTGAVVGTLATASASLAVRQVDVVLADSNGISVFASDPVPSGKVWDVSGTWTFRTYMRASTSTRLWMRARVYRVQANGNTTEIAYSQDGTRRDITTSYQLFSWTYSMPAGTTLNSGERFAVRFYVYPDSDQPGQYAYLGFDTTAQNSRVDAQVTESAAPSSVRNNHWRIGKDTALSAMDWYADTDSLVSNMQRNTNFRLRLQLFNEGTSNVNWQPRLEYTTTPGSGWAAIPTTSGAAPFFISNTTQFNNGDPIATSTFALGTGPGTAQTGVAYDTVNPPPAAITLNSGSYTEVEFSVQANSNAVLAQPYYFRLTNNGTALASYDNGDAQIVVAPPWPPTPTPGPPAHNLHQPYAADTSSCAACHRAHTANAPQALEKQWPQEQTCFTCHDGTGAPNIMAQFNKPYKMPLTTTSTLHSLSEARDRNPASFSGSNRHVACTDCHNPHYAAQGSHTFPSNYAFGPLQGVWGVAVANGGSWTEPTYSIVDRVQFEYQLCFKCHSSWAYGSNPPNTPSGGYPQTNQAKEFNPANHSQMPVEDVGRNPFRFPNGTSYASSLINGDTPTSRITCTDCHRSETPTDPKGPHGSTNPFILRGAWNRQTGRPGTQNDLCFTCHDYNVYVVNEGLNNATGFSGAKPNLHAFHIQKATNRGQPAVCMDCHVAIPHGYNRDHLLGFTSDPAPYINRPLGGGLTQIDQWAQPGGWQFASCQTAMDAGCHGP